MERQRLRDGLVGAAVAVLVLVLLLVGLLWWVTTPVGDAGAGAAGTPSPSVTPRADDDAAPDAPLDLAPGDIWLGDLTLDSATVATADGVVRDVTVTGTDVRTGADGLAAGSMTMHATVPFDLVAEQIGNDVTVTAGRSGQAAVVRTFEFAGRELRVVASGTVDVVDGRLVIEPRTIDVGGPAFLSNLAGGLARRLVTIEHTIEGLPEGLVLQEVTVQEDGFRATLSGDDVRIAAGDVGLVP